LAIKPALSEVKRWGSDGVHGPDAESNTASHSKSGLFDTYGVSRKELLGGVLSTYVLFTDDDQTVTTIYLLNAEPVERKFKTIDEYRKLRDDFLNEYVACLQLGTKQQP
jgi:hypothetical protein